MEFFDKISKKTNTMIDSNKIKGNINTQKNERTKLYTLLGEKVYNNFDKLGEVQNEFMTDCEQIRECESKISEFEDKLTLLQGKKTCKKCGADIESEAKFCPSCGETQE